MNMTSEEVANGFLRVANESMSRPIRSLTEGRGIWASQHVLATFGGAGGQHACDVTETLGACCHTPFLVYSVCIWHGACRPNERNPEAPIGTAIPTYCNPAATGVPSLRCEKAIH